MAITLRLFLGNNFKYLQATSRLLGLFLISLLLGGCLKTYITREAVSPQIFQLAAMAPRSLVLETEHELTSSTVGHQYLFLLLPFGRVVVDHVEQFLERSAYDKLALLGYRPLSVSAAEARDSRAPRLKIKVKELSLSGYDFFLFRRVVCSLELEAKYQSATDAAPFTVHTNSYASALKRFAFAQELRAVHEECLGQALDDLFRMLGIDPKPAPTYT